MAQREEIAPKRAIAKGTNNRGAREASPRAEASTGPKEYGSVDTFGQKELEGLMQLSPAPTVSIFMPTHRAGPETQQDPIRLKNLLKGAATKLGEQGLDEDRVKTILRPAEDLLGETGFWQYQLDGLALYLREDGPRIYRVPLNLPEFVSAGEGAYVKPLLPLLTGDGRFFVLALSQKDIRLLEGSRDGVSEYELEDIPKGLEEALVYDEPTKHLQWRAGAPGGARGKAAVFHGHDPRDEQKQELLRYFRVVAEGVEEILRGRQEPLVLAGVDYLLPIYRDANRYPHLLEGGIEGNPEGLRPEELHAKAWELVKPVFERGEDEARRKFEGLDGTGQTATELETVIPAADHGRIQTLFVALGERCWGRYDPERGEAAISEEPGSADRDLLDLAAVRTLLTGGTVYAVARERVPRRGLAAAVLRY